MKICAMIMTVLYAGILIGCSSTQKTGGGGLVSVVTQNVVRIAGVQAMKEADLSKLKEQPTFIRLTGFVDEQNRGFIEHIVRSAAEDAGAGLVTEDKASIILEAVVHNAGNDFGKSRVPLISRSERTEAAVDMDLIMRNAEDGKKISTQHVRGEAKYQQNTVLGFQGSGTYYVKDNKDDFLEVSDPIKYR